MSTGQNDEQIFPEKKKQKKTPIRSYQIFASKPKLVYEKYDYFSPDNWSKRTKNPIV